MKRGQFDTAMKRGQFGTFAKCTRLACLLGFASLYEGGLTSQFKILCNSCAPSDCWVGEYIFSEIHCVAKLSLNWSWNGHLLALRRVLRLARMLYAFMYCQNSDLENLLKSVRKKCLRVPVWVRGGRGVTAIWARPSLAILKGLP